MQKKQGKRAGEMNREKFTLRTGIWAMNSFTASRDRGTSNCPIGLLQSEAIFAINVFGPIPMNCG